jgi:hypothetical protein
MAMEMLQQENPGRGDANMDDEISMELTPAEVEALSALIDQCLKIIKESNERSELVYAEIAQSRAETQRIS